MSILDFGASPKRLNVGMIVLTCLIGVLLTLGSVIPKMLTDHQAALADTAAWTISGPPCPAVSEAQFRASHFKDRHRFSYSDTIFGRAIGHASCAQLRYPGWRGWFAGYPVCQFTSPAALTVETSAGRWYFLTGLGRRVTISAPEGRPQCVLAGDFRG